MSRLVPTEPRAVCLGVFLGGASRRMGGVPKGLLQAPDRGEAIVARWKRLSAEVGLRTLWVGDAAEYAGRLPEGPVIADAPPGIGPLGGLHGLLGWVGQGRVIAVACDMPYVSISLLARLAACGLGPAVVAPRDPVTGKWQPLFASYDAPRCLPVVRASIARGRHALQATLQQLDVAELPLAEGERHELDDWDAPEDLARRRPGR